MSFEILRINIKKLYPKKYGRFCCCYVEMFFTFEMKILNDQYIYTVNFKQ